MRIGFVTQWFPPEPGTGVAADIAEGLAARGHEVEVVTGLPNYPTGRIHDGYPLRPYQVEQRGGVRVHRCLLYPSHNRSAVQRAANYLSFAATATWAARKVPAPDAWLVYSSPATAALPALLASRRRPAPVFLLIQDLWPDSVLGSGFLGSRTSGVAWRVLDRFCRWTYDRATGVGVISPGMAAVLEQRGVPTTRIHHVPNPSPPDDRHGPVRSRSELRLPAGRLFMYAGNVGQLQGLEPVLHAFRQVPEATFVIVGDGVERERLEQLVRSWDVANIHFLGSQPAERARELARAADVLVISLQDTPLLRATMPSKVQAALGAGRPVLAHAAGDVAALVEREGCGWTAAPGDVSQLIVQIRTVCRSSAAELTRRGERGRGYATRTFAPEVTGERLTSMLETASAQEGLDLVHSTRPGP